MANLKACVNSGKIVLFSPVTLTIGDDCNTLRSLVISLVGNGFKDIIIDLSNCNYIDSVGFAILAGSFIHCDRRGGSLNLNKIPPKIKALLEMMNLLSSFYVIDNDYSNSPYFDISPENLTELNKAIAISRIDTLSLLLTVSKGRLQILPSVQDGIYRISLTDRPNSELIIAAPFIMADTTRSYIRDEIEEFEAIINSPISSEHDIQKFIEKHPKFLLGHEYEKLHPQIVLEREEEGSLIPDFLVQPFGKDYCDIVDLKLPKKSLIVGIDNRKRFSSAISEAAAQLRTYSNYFDDRENRDKIKEKYGITAYKPRLAVIIGKSAGIDGLVYRQVQSDYQNLEVITYNDLIKKAKKFILP